MMEHFSSHRRSTCVEGREREKEKKNPPLHRRSLVRRWLSNFRGMQTISRTRRGEKMEEEKNRKGKKKCKPFCSSSQMGRLSVCITIMEFRAHWQKFTNSSQHPARINNVEALEWRMARCVSKYQSRSAVCSTKQQRPLIVESWKKFGGQRATTVLVVVVFGGRRWGGGAAGSDLASQHHTRRR